MNVEWIENAVGLHADYSANPLWGHVAESDEGTLLLPSWWWVQRRHADDTAGGWWDRRLNLRNPLHWLPYWRSRVEGRVAMVESC